MQIINSLKNKNIKKYLILSILTILIVNIIIISSMMLFFNNEKKNIINKYEVETLNQSFAINEINNKIYKYIYVLIGTNILTLFVITIYYLSSLNNNEKEVKNLRKYLQALYEKNYNVDIQNISESEFSNLKNEIYKIVLELKEKSENLAKDRETLSNYLADISHQIRTPLMAITAMTDAIIENEDNLDNDTKKFIFEISRQLNQINWLIDNLLKMAQLDTKTITMKEEQVDIKELFSTIQKNMSIFLEQKNQSLIINVNENINAYIDKKWMIEAIENILKNCIEHSKENSKIEIECIKNPLYTEIQIKDEGTGISKEDLPKIFDKFYKGKNSSSNSFGIGLSLAKSIIENHNGEISVESEENKGSKFIIKLYNVK